MSLGGTEWQGEPHYTLATRSLKCRRLQGESWNGLGRWDSRGRPGRGHALRHQALHEHVFEIALQGSVRLLLGAYLFCPPLSQCAVPHRFVSAKGLVRDDLAPRTHRGIRITAMLSVKAAVAFRHGWPGADGVTAAWSPGDGCPPVGSLKRLESKSAVIVERVGPPVGYFSGHIRLVEKGDRPIERVRLLSPPSTQGVLLAQQRKGTQGTECLRPEVCPPPYGPWGALGPERIAVLEWVLSATALRGCACAFAFLFSVFIRSD